MIFKKIFIFILIFTDKRRACFKGRYPGTSANLKKYVDLEKDHMEMFLRSLTLSFILFRETFLESCVD